MNLSLLPPNETFQLAWQLLGWTMILFLAAGTIVFLIGGVLRLALRRANPNLRYATSLATFALLALTPIVVAAYLASQQASLPLDPTSLPPHPTSLPRQWGEAPTPTPLTNRYLSAEHDNLPPLTREARVTNLVRERGDSPVAASNVTAADFDFSRLLTWGATYLPWLWCVGTPFTFLLLATGLIGAERLRKSCQLLHDGPIHAACDELRAALGITRQVGVAVCERIATPILVGVVKPLMLLPPAALNGWTTAELEMVLVHELAHVRRWDNAVNLGQRIVESLLFFHPAVWIVSGWVRRDREDCCDAAVVRHTATPQAYAELLVALASHSPGLAASAALAEHPVAARIRRILKLEDEPMLITRKGLTIGVAMVLATVLLAVALPANDSFSREAERVADERAPDERSEPTNPTVERYEQVTTKDTKDTKDELNADDANEKDLIVEKVFEPGKTMVQFFPHPANPQTVEEAVKELNEIGHNVTIRPTKNGTALLVEDAEQPQASRQRQRPEDIASPTAETTNPTRKRVEEEDLTTEDTESTEDDGGGDREFPDDIDTIRALFEVRNTNPLKRVEYACPEDHPNQIENIFEGFQRDPYGPKVEFEWEWLVEGYQIAIEAPQEAHNKFFQPMFDRLSHGSRRRNASDSDSDFVKQLKDQVREDLPNRERQRPEDIASPPAETILPPRQRGEEEDLTTKDTESTEETETIGVSHEVVLERVPIEVDDDPIWIETQKALIKSPLILSRVVQDPKISQLPVVQRAKPDALTWLSEKISITFSPNRIMLLRLSGPTRDKEELRTVARAVIERYLDERKAQTQQNPLFPTLEEQRAADLAYKLLGVELEKLTPEELELVKEKGYKGGLRVAGPRFYQQNETVSPLMYEDLLVGLHVWPTESLNQVTEILSRDDLDQLSPLKFYLIRPVREGRRGGGRPGMLAEGPGRPSLPGALITGRIQVDLDAWRAMREPALKQLVALHEQIQEELLEKEKLRDDVPAEERAMLNAEITQLREILNSIGRRLEIQPSQGEPSSETEANLLYDGKTFDQWRNELMNASTEVDTRKALERLLAFAHLGQARRVADALWELAAEGHSSKLSPLTIVRDFPPNVLLEYTLKGAASQNADVREFSQHIAEWLAGYIPSVIPQLREKFADLDPIDIQKETAIRYRDRHGIASDTGPVPEAQIGDVKTNANVDTDLTAVQSQSPLLYDGKTFDQWRNLWKTELKTEKRIECIKALAAFGRAGQGQEASEAILDVAGEYDFRIISDGSAGDLKQAITEVLVGTEGFPGQYWLPLLMERVKGDPDKWSYFAYWVLGDVQGKDVIPSLKQLANSSSLSAEARGAALAGMARQPDLADDPEALTMVRESLTGDKPVMQVFNALRFNHLEVIPEQFELLFHKNAQIRIQTLGIAASGGGADIESVLSKLLEILDDPARSDDHEKAIVALFRLNGYYVNLPERRQPIADKTTEILVSGDTQLLPASLALMSLLTHKGESLVIKELGDKISDERRNELEAAIEQAKELQSQRSFGGGGGMGGGGMF